MDTTIISMLQTSVDWVTLAFEAPFARAVVFGVQIGGHLFVEGLLFVVILYLLSQKSYAPPKKPLTEEDSCTSAVEKYGVGSCGPRGFYGTIDVHLDCDPELQSFWGRQIQYFTHMDFPPCLAQSQLSVKKAMSLLCLSVFILSDGCSSRDEGVHWGIQIGLHLSRSKIVHFKHNNMESLKRTLETITTENKRKKTRRYIVIKAVYQNSGQVAPLDEIVKLKEEYCFRLMMDESNSFGVQGSSGKGLTEHFNVPVEKVDIITAAMGHALAAEGGFCTGNASVIDHQLVPVSAIDVDDVFEENPNLISKLKENVAKLRTGSSEKDIQLLEDIVDELLEKHNIFVVTSKQSTLDKCPIPVGIKLFVSAGHGESDIIKVCEALKMAVPSVLNNPAESLASEN
uniref:serine C-palmitoyltransferase n=1 Tax=Chenopodium quinoa TaxID=63459 RepID=A0A803L3R4_CHEQI